MRANCKIGPRRPLRAHLNLACSLASSVQTLTAPPSLPKSDPSPPRRHPTFRTPVRRRAQIIPTREAQARPAAQIRPPKPPDPKNRKHDRERQRPRIPERKHRHVQPIVPLVTDSPLNGSIDRRRRQAPRPEGIRGLLDQAAARLGRSERNWKAVVSDRHHSATFLERLVERSLTEEPQLVMCRRHPPRILQRHQKRSRRRLHP